MARRDTTADPISSPPQARLRARLFRFRARTSDASGPITRRCSGSDPSGVCQTQHGLQGAWGWWRRSESCRWSRPGTGAGCSRLQRHQFAPACLQTATGRSPSTPFFLFGTPDVCRNSLSPPAIWRQILVPRCGEAKPKVSITYLCSTRCHGCFGGSQAVGRGAMATITAV